MSIILKTVGDTDFVISDGLTAKHKDDLFLWQEKHNIPLFITPVVDDINDRIYLRLFGKYRLDAHDRALASVKKIEKEFKK